MIEATPSNDSGDSAQRPRRNLRLRLILVGLVLVLLIVGIGWYLSLPNVSNSAANLSESDKAAIARLCRGYTLDWCFTRLRRAEFGPLTLGLRNLFRQRIDRIIDDRNGTYRAYVVVYDRNAPDGFNAWSRHLLTKTNGHWKIVRSY
jgi:hypothetical protein